MSFPNPQVRGGQYRILGWLRHRLRLAFIASNREYERVLRTEAFRAERLSGKSFRLPFEMRYQVRYDENKVSGTVSYLTVPTQRRAANASIRKGVLELDRLIAEFDAEFSSSGKREDTWVA